MESHHQQEAAGKNSTSTRWTPTTDQIRILKDLYYNNRVRSPSAEQIQRIAAKLRQFGKIEGKNVFYWFQNHKARERQKKRLFTPSDHHIASMQPPTLPPPSGPSVFHPDQMIHHHYHLLHHPNVSPVYRNFTSAIGNFPCGSSSYSSPSGGVMMNVGGYGSSSASASSSMATEKSFRECSITPGGGSKGQQFTWIGVDPNSHSSSSCSSSSFCGCSPYPFLDKRKYPVMNSSSPDHQTLKMEELEEAEIETLPLFPMHGLQDDCIKHNHTSDCTNYYNGCQYRGRGDAAGCSRASLELALNSYAARFPKSP